MTTTPPDVAVVEQVNIPGGAEGGEAPPPPLRSRLFTWRTGLSLLLTVALFALFAHELGSEALAQSWAKMRQANLWLYLAAIGVYYLSIPVRGLRWRYLLINTGEPAERIPPVRDLSIIIYISWFINTIVPAKLGDLYRGWLLRRQSGISWSKGMGTIVAERILDVIVLVVLMVATGFLTFGDVMQSALVGGPVACLESGIHVEAVSCTLLQVFALGAILAAVLIVGLLLFARFGGHLERFLPGRLSTIYVHFQEGVVLSFSSHFGPILTLSVLAWLCESGAFILVGKSLGLHLSVSLMVFLSLLQAFATALPFTAGGAGVAELALLGALRLRGYTGGDMGALVLLYRTISFLSLIVGGAIIYFKSSKTK